MTTQALTLNDEVHPPLTTAQYLAERLRKVANSFDGGETKVPTPAEVAADQLRAARVALLHAEAELEERQHVVAMLSARVDRLKSLDT